MNSRNTNIDLSKSIACLGILGLHCIGYVNYTLYYICTFSVPVFFMVNGYLMFNKQSVTVKYSLGKILSLLRIIIIWNLIITIPMMILKHKFINPLDQIGNSVIQQGYLWHFWFFGTLILLYLLLVPLHKLVNHPKFGLTIHIVLCTLLLILCILNTVYSCYSHYPMGILIPQSLRLWISLFYYLSGGLIAKVVDKKVYKNLPIIPLAIFVFILGIVCNYGQKHLGLYMYSNRAAEHFYDELTVIIWCISIFILFLKINIPEKLCKVIIGFSKLSLGVFIIHPLILKVSETFFEIKTTPQAIALWGLITILSVITAFVISKIPYVKKLIEL